MSKIRLAGLWGFARDLSHGKVAALDLMQALDNWVVATLMESLRIYVDTMDIFCLVVTRERKREREGCVVEYERWICFTCHCLSYSDSLL